MELKEFIENTLVSIIGAVNEVQEKVKDTSVIINPSRTKDGYLEISAGGGGRQKVTNINFDVAVAVKGKNEGKTKGGIMVLQAIGIGAEQADSTENKHYSRVQFSIPVVLSIRDDLEKKAIDNQYDTLNIMANSML